MSLTGTLAALVPYHRAFRHEAGKCSVGEIVGVPDHCKDHASLHPHREKMVKDIDSYCHVGCVCVSVFVQTEFGYK